MGGRRWTWLRALLWIALLAVVALGVWATRGGTRWPTVYYMTGPSMEPTVAAGEYFVAWRPPGTLVPGDLVVFRYVDEDGEFDVLRRLAALPGDTVEMEAGVVKLNGRPQPWPFQILEPAAWRSPLAIGGDLYDWGPWVVPPDSVLLLSDIRDIGGWPDSRFIGFVARDEILARVGSTLGGLRLR